MKNEIIVFGLTGTFIPALSGSIEYTTDTRGCGVLKFAAVKEGMLDFKEGNCVIARCDGKMYFKGWVFEKTRDKSGIINTVCYDQLRYFKNKDCCTYHEKKASDLLRMLAADNGLETGDIEDTGYIIPYRIEDNAALFDIMYNALDITRRNTGREYVLYDDCGRLCLKNGAGMLREYHVCAQNCIDLRYTSSIDRDTYNSIKLVHSDARSGIYNVYAAENAESRKRFGKLQYYSHISGDINGAGLANELLAQHNRTGRLLAVRAMGDMSLRAGCVVRVDLDLGDFMLNCYMQCKNVRHSISDTEHTMLLTLKGGEFVYDG